MTKIEMQAMDAVIGIHREMKKANEVDWEQRRYEIAKEMMPAAYEESEKFFSEAEMLPMTMWQRLR